MKLYREYNFVQYDGTASSLIGAFSSVQEADNCKETDVHHYISNGRDIYVKVGDYIGYRKMNDYDNYVLRTKESLEADGLKTLSEIRGRRPRPSEEANNFAELCSLNRDRIYRLLELGVLTDGKDNVRDHNVGESNYAEHTIQAWSVWMDWELDPWDADIVKRIERTKQGEESMEKYDKIEHICQERKRQLRLERNGQESDLLEAMIGYAKQMRDE